MDDASFEAYVESRGTALTRMAYLLCGSHSDAGDLLCVVLRQLGSTAV